jgi:hypothetical protein
VKKRGFRLHFSFRRFWFVLEKVLRLLQLFFVGLPKVFLASIDEVLDHPNSRSDAFRADFGRGHHRSNGFRIFRAGDRNRSELALVDDNSRLVVDGVGIFVVRLFGRVGLGVVPSCLVLVVRPIRPRPPFAPRFARAFNHVLVHQRPFCCWGRSFGVVEGRKSRADSPSLDRTCTLGAHSVGFRHFEANWYHRCLRVRMPPGR